MQSTHEINGTCVFCGKKLEPIPVPEFLREQGMRSLGVYMECDCEDARAQRAMAAEEERIRLAELERQRIACSYKRAGIPKRYWQAEIDTDEGRDALAKIENGRGVYLTGGVGVGKTYIACAICRELVKRGWRVRFADVEAISREVTSTWSSNDSTEEGVIKSWTSADLAVIDDLGAEEMTSVTMRVMRAIINGRDADDKVTIFTSNLDRVSFATHLADEADELKAERIASRIAGMTEVIEVHGKDRRVM